MKLNRGPSSESVRTASSGIEYCSLLDVAVNVIIANYTRN